MCKLRYDLLPSGPPVSDIDGFGSSRPVVIAGTSASGTEIRISVGRNPRAGKRPARHKGINPHCTDIAVPISCRAVRTSVFQEGISVAKPCRDVWQPAGLPDASCVQSILIVFAAAPICEGRFATARSSPKHSEAAADSHCHCGSTPALV